MYAEERRQRIRELLELNKRVDVAELAEMMGSSPETIRRDLREMEVGGLLRRTHGGAIAIAETRRRSEIHIQSRKAINFRLKAAVAKRAAEFVEDGDVIAIDNSSTAYCLLEYLPRHYKITVLTNSIQVILEILSFSGCSWTCVSLGGVLHHNYTSTYGFLACRTLDYLRPDKLFMSCFGVDGDGSMTEGNLKDVEIKLAMLGRSRVSYLLLDEMKWGRVGTAVTGPVSKVDYIVTNSGADRQKMEFLSRMDVELLFDTV